MNYVKCFLTRFQGNNSLLNMVKIVFRTLFIFNILGNQHRRLEYILYDSSVLQRQYVSYPRIGEPTWPKICDKQSVLFFIHRFLSIFKHSRRFHYRFTIDYVTRCTRRSSVVFVSHSYELATILLNAEFIILFINLF